MLNRAAEIEKQIRFWAIVLATAVLCPVLPVCAQTPLFISFEAPDAGTAGGQGTLALTINRHGAAAGQYADSSYHVHGFFRSADGQITEFDGPRLNGTVVSAMNDLGQIIGNAESLHRSGINYGFLRNPDGAFVLISPPGAITTYANGINDSGEIAGNYIDAVNLVHGFVRHADGGYNVFDEPDANKGMLGEGTFVAAITAQGEALGSYSDPLTGQLHGYLRDSSGSFTAFDAPDAGDCRECGTNPVAINAQREIAGSYSDNRAHFHAFFRDSAGTITEFDVPGATETYAVSIGSNREVLGGWTDGYFWYGYARDTSGRITTTTVFPRSINTAGRIGGYYDDLNGRAHGLIYQF